MRCEAEARMMAVVGETLSHYRIVRPLGRGGLGEVYLAEDLRLRRPVALKLLRPDVRGDVSARDRLLAEARAASALSHPAIAVVYEVDEVEKDGAPLAFIAMEYIPGRTLSELARDGLPLDRVLDLGIQVAEALEAAHAKGIVHRDVKPANVVLSESGRVKVLDFGLAARALPGETDLTWTRDPLQEPEAAGLVGTLAYMAPEQALGRSVDARADVFSLGALLYEMTVGRPAFTGANAVQLLDASSTESPRRCPPVARRGSRTWTSCCDGCSPRTRRVGTPTCARRGRTWSGCAAANRRGPRPGRPRWRC